MSEPISKQSKASPRSASTWAAVMPEAPAPMMQVVAPAGSAVMGRDPTRDWGHVDNDPDHRGLLRTGRRDGPSVRRPRTRPRAVRPAYRTARGARGRDPGRPPRPPDR